jgi:hypothetical protein
VIEVVVGDDDGVDGRQVLEAKSGRRHASGACEADRTGSLRPLWIGEDVDAVELDQQCRVPDPREGRFAAVGAQQRAVVAG